MGYVDTSGDVYKFRSPQHPGKPPLQQPLTSPGQRNSRLGHSLHSSSRHVRERNSRKRLRDSISSVQSMDTDGSSSTVGSNRNTPRETSIDEPKPTNVVSDIPPPSRTAKRNPSSLHSSAEPHPKRSKTSQAAYKHEESEDELHTSKVNDVRSPPPRKRTSLFNGPPTAASLRNRHLHPKKPSSPVSPRNATSKNRTLELAEAAGDSYLIRSKGDAHIILQESRSDSGIWEPWTHAGKRMQTEWLNIHVPSVRKILASATHSPIIILYRPGGVGTSSQLALRFASREDAALFLSVFDESKQRVCEREPERLQRLLKTAMERAADFEKSSAGQQPTRVAETRLSATRTSESKPVETKSSEKKTPEMKPSDTSTALANPTVQREMVTRQTRNSLPRYSYREREKSPYRWTDNNPGWELQWKRSLVYPETGRNRATVDKDDVPRLDEGEFLNDNLINFYMRYLQADLEQNRPDLMKRIHIFSTFFYEKLASQRGKINYEGVRSWTSRVDVFSLDYLIVPVNENAHWYLAIICNVPKTIEPPDINTILSPGSTKGGRRAVTGSPRLATVERGLSDISLNEDSPRRSFRHQSAGLTSGTDSKKFSTPDPPTGKSRRTFGTPQKLDPDQPRIITLDSLGDSHSPTCSALRQYLAKEAEDKRNTALTNVPSGLTAKSVPQQNNYCDCGVYVLAYAAEFLKNPDATARKLLMKEDVGWSINPSTVRNDVRSLLFQLREEQKAAAHKASTASKDKLEAKKDETKGPVEDTASKASVSTGGMSHQSTSGGIQSKYFARKSRSMDYMPRINVPNASNRPKRSSVRDVPVVDSDVTVRKPANDSQAEGTKNRSSYDGIERNIPID